MGEIMGFIAAAVIVEGILSYVREIVENKKIHWEIIGAILIGCLVSFNLNLDFFEMLGLKETYGIIGVKVWIYKGEVFAKQNKGGND